jgi:hypothetical protein
MILILDAKRRLTLPASLVLAQPDDHFRAEFDPEEDAVVFRRIAKKADWLNVLKACPVKMDDLPPRRRGFPKRLKLWAGFSIPTSRANLQKNRGRKCHRVA